MKRKFDCIVYFNNTSAHTPTKTKMTLIFAVLFLLFAKNAFGVLFHKEEVIKDYYTLEWGVENGVIEFQCTVKTVGWIGIGISPAGAMPNSDIVMAWIDKDGKAVVSDRHVGSSPALPIEDKSQDLMDANVTESNGITTLRFKRKLVACDVDDLTIAGTSRVLFAFGRSKPENNVPTQHQSTDRLQKNIDLVNAKFPDPPIGNEYN